jgi:hypothetical protein
VFSTAFCQGRADVPFLTPCSVQQKKKLVSSEEKKLKSGLVEQAAIKRLISLKKPKQT